MRRFLALLKFELKKTLSRKKAILFLLALNVVPLLASILSLMIYIKFKGWGLGPVSLSMLVSMMKNLFIAHIKLFAWISPFFLALVIGDSISGEAGRGHLKTLLLTPVTREQVIVGKAISILGFLLLAVIFGGFLLQVDLWVARALTDSPTLIPDVLAGKLADNQPDLTLVSTSAAAQLFVMLFIANLAMVGFFILFAMFSDMPILMAFISLIVLMSMQTYVLMAPFLAKLDDRHEKVAQWIFTRHLSNLFDFDVMQKILDGSITLTAQAIREPLTACLGWAVFFFLLAILIFRRKHILS